MELENKCEIKTFKHLSTFDLFKISDIVLCGFSTVAYEALFLGAQPVRVIDPYQPQFFDLKDGLPIVENRNKLKKLLKIKKFKNKLPLSNFIKRNYFFKLDNCSKKRFWNSLNRI